MSDEDLPLCPWCQAKPVHAPFRSQVFTTCGARLTYDSEVRLWFADDRCKSWSFTGSELEVDSQGFARMELEFHRRSWIVRMEATQAPGISLPRIVRAVDYYVGDFSAHWTADLDWNISR